MSFVNVRYINYPPRNIPVYPMHFNILIKTSLACKDGEVRLVDGISITNGRVEICIKQTWVTVCGDSFDLVDVEVVCKQLGFFQSGMFNFKLRDNNYL